MSTAASRALAEAIAFLQGVADKEPAKAAASVIEQLALRGFSVQPTSSPVVADLTSETLRHVRKALGLTLSEVAAKAGLSTLTVSRAETGASQSQRGTRQAIGAALVQLGARNPER